MASVVSFSAARTVGIVHEPRRALGREQVRVRTLFSGISAGTELTAYRGTNPYLNRTWDPEQRLFLPGGGGLEYPVNGWGYEEVGEIVEIGAGVSGLDVGDRVWGTWGHRSEVVREESYFKGRLLPANVDPRVGIFSQIGAIALNVILDADIHVGETVAVFGLGVPGQLVAQLARLNGANVVGVDMVSSRRKIALELGIHEVLDPQDGSIAPRVRSITGGRGADVCLEVTGNYDALHEAIRTVAYSSRVCVAGFMQGEGHGLRLGDEFHHNRVQMIASQISGVAPALQHRWNSYRLAKTAIDLAVSERLSVIPLISHMFPMDRAADAFSLLDNAASDVMQVVLEASDSGRDPRSRTNVGSTDG